MKRVLQSLREQIHTLHFLQRPTVTGILTVKYRQLVSRFGKRTVTLFAVFGFCVFLLLFVVVWNILNIHIWVLVISPRMMINVVFVVFLLIPSILIVIKRYPSGVQKIVNVAGRFARFLVARGKGWLIRLETSTPRERFRMVRVPLAIFVALVFLWKFGSFLVPPKIMTSFPGDSSSETPLTSDIEVIFDRGILKASAEKSFSISPQVAGVFHWEGNQKLIFSPAQPLRRGESYTVSFRGVVLSSFLIPRIEQSPITFQTIGNPKVVLASPQSEAQEDFSPITVVFDRQMIPLTTATNSALKKDAFAISPPIDGAGRWLGTTAFQFRPSERLKKATTYTVTIPKGMHSQDGGVLAEEYSWQFSSVRPHVDAVSPDHNYNYVSPTASVAAFFNQPIDPKSVNDKLVLYDSKNNKIPGRFVVTGSVVGFYPFRPLARSEYYRAEVLKGIRGLQGPNEMEDQAYSWTFTVASAPQVIGSTPKTGATNVGEEYDVRVQFKTPMDEESFAENVTIDPQPETTPSLSFSSYDNSLSIGSYFGRSIRYTITVTSNVKDQYGVALGTPYAFSFQTAPYKPAISIYPGNTFFGAFNQSITPRVVAQVVNANTVDYSLYKLKREDLLDLYRRRYDYGSGCGSEQGCSNWQNYNPTKLEKVRSWSESYQADLNTPVHVVTKVTAQDGGQLPAGFYFLDLRIPQGAHDNMVMIVSKSALTVKKSDSQIFSWGVNQTTGDVTTNMHMQLTDSYGSVLSEGNTNADGVFQNKVNLFQKENLLVFGQSNDDMVVASSAWGEGINRSDFGLPSYYDPNESQQYSTPDSYKLFVTLDRPIYRPGQKVYFKGVIRKDNDGAYENLPPSEKVSVTVKDSQSRSIYSQSLPITTFGSFSGEIVLSRDASLNNYQVIATYQGSTYTQNFQVEEYRKPDVALSISPSKEAYVDGEQANITLNASYYFGAPVTDAPVSWNLSTQDSSFHWDKNWRYEFGDPDSYWSRPWWFYSGSSYFSGKNVTEGKGKTDGKGNLELQLPLDIGAFDTSQQMTVEAVVNDINNQANGATQTFMVHKAGMYAGLHPERYANESGKEAKVDVVAVDLAGKEQANVPISVEFFKRTWDTVREKNPDDGLFYFVSKPVDTSVASSAVTTDSLGYAVASFTPSEGGTYKVVAKIRDSSGKENVSGSFLWVSGYGFTASRENNDRIVVVTDKRDYLVGDDMSVFVASPFASSSAKTLLTAERGTVLGYKIVDTSPTSNNFVLPIPPAYSPNVFIGAVVVKGGSEVKNPPEFKIGYSEVMVTDKKQQIVVNVTTDKIRYKPKETLKATIQTNDVLGHPVAAELALGLVDKAVWDLSGVTLPDIYQTFYQPRNLAVATSQLLTISLDRINANTNLGAKGGSGGGCFTGDTPVLMEGGVYKPIGTIAIGDVVLTRENEQSPKLVPAKVINTYKHNVDEYLILNGYLRVTSVHRMFVNGAWKTAGAIEKGDWLVNKDNQPIRVYSIERVSGAFDVYNLEIETYRTYFAGDIYVHNQKGGNDTTRTNFPDTAYWNPTLTTGKDGKASVEIPLPDSLTTWRLAAIANSQDSAFGSKVAEVVVSRDVLIRPFMPRFLAVGDQSQLGGIIVNTSGQNQSVTATIKTEGITVNEEKAKQISLPDGAEAKVTWSTTAQNTSSGKVTLSVSGEDSIIKDAVETTIPIKSYSIPEVVATSGEAKDTASETITLPKDVDPTQGQGSLTFSPSLGSASFLSFPYLFSYPYDGPEQIVSRFLPSLSLLRILKAAAISGIGPVDQQQTEKVISDSIQSLNTTQHIDGGWGWWPEYESSPYLTAYAVLGLNEAKNDHVTVSDQTLLKGRSYLVNVLAYPQQRVSLSEQAFILYALRGQNTDLSSYAANLYQRRFELSLEARIYLALVMRELPSMAGNARRVYDDVVSLAKITATTVHWEEPKIDYAYMGSNTTANAAMLEALTNFDPTSPLIPQLVRYLLSTRVDTHWSSTRDTAAVIRAIGGVLMKKQDAKVNESYKVTVNGKEITQGQFSQQDLLSIKESLLSVAQLGIGKENKLQIYKSGQGNLYYNLNLKYYLPFSEITPLEQGMVIVREFVDADGKILPSASMKENTEAWVRLTIVAPEERHFVTVEDVLPAGLEAVNESLKNADMVTASPPPVTTKNGSFWYFDHREYHDDRTTLFANYLPPGVYEILYRVRATTPGKYHYPPAQAYQTYIPDVSGHSSGGWLEIQSR